MADIGKLAHFDIEPDGRGFTLRFVDDVGKTITLQASSDQLDMMADAIDDALLSDGSGDPTDD